MWNSCFFTDMPVKGPDQKCKAINQSENEKDKDKSNQMWTTKSIFVSNLCFIAPPPFLCMMHFLRYSTHSAFRSRRRLLNVMFSMQVYAQGRWRQRHSKDRPQGTTGTLPASHTWFTYTRCIRFHGNPSSLSRISELNLPLPSPAGKTRTHTHMRMHRCQYIVIFGHTKTEQMPANVFPFKASWRLFHREI